MAHLLKACSSACRAVAASILFGLASYGPANAGLLIDPATGCKIDVPWTPTAGTVANWTGKCNSNRMADGDGVLTIITNGRATAIGRFSAAGGLNMSNGNMRIEVPPSAVTATYVSDGIRCGVIKAIVEPAVDLAVEEVLNQVIAKLRRDYDAACPGALNRIGMVYGSIFYRGHETRGLSADVSFSIERSGKLAWHGFSAHASQETQLGFANQRIRAEEQRKQEEARRAGQAALNQRAAELRKSFYSNVTLTQNAPSISNLTTNVFAYNGNTVSYVARFAQMVSAQDALFLVGQSAFMLKGAPLDQLREPGQYVVAGRVDGNTQYSSGMGTALLPVLKYVKLYRCQQSSCEEFVGTK
jgi:hypothetical protein